MSTCLPSYTLNSNSSNLLLFFEKFCTTFRFALYPGFCHLVILLSAILIIVSVFGKISEDYKWFVLHSAIFNFVDTIFTEFNGTVKIVNFVVPYLDGLAASSILPRSFSRFLVFYLPNYYKKLFHKQILLWLLGYDLYIIVVLALTNFFKQFYILAIMQFLFMCITITLSLLLILKIKKSIELLKENSTRTNTLKELRRAAVGCFVQAFMFLIYMLAIIYSNVFQKRHSKGYFVEENLMLFVFLITYSLGGTLYELVVIVDSSLTLFFLKSYRNVVFKIFQSIFGMCYRNRAERMESKLFAKR